MGETPKRFQFTDDDKKLLAGKIIEEVGELRNLPPIVVTIVRAIIEQEAAQLVERIELRINELIDRAIQGAT